MRRFVTHLLLLALLPVVVNAESSCAPGVSFWSLLGAVGIGYADGQLRMEKLYAVCLPTPATPSESNYAYSPDQGGKLTTLVKDAEGKTLATYVWSAENISGLWELSGYKVLGGYESLKPLAEGRYVLEFDVEGTPFYRFPFSVRTAPSDDPYAPPGIRYFVDGAWSEYGNVFFQRNDPQSSLRFTTWVEAPLTRPQEKKMAYAAELTRVRDGKVLGRDSGELRVAPEWNELDILFRPEGGDGSSYLKAAGVLAEDGAYRVRFTLDGKPYGDYPFGVSGGKIEVQGKQAAPASDPERIVDYLYGGRYRSWWIRRQSPSVAIAR